MVSTCFPDPSVPSVLPLTNRKHDRYGVKKPFKTNPYMEFGRQVRNVEKGRRNKSEMRMSTDTSPLSRKEEKVTSRCSVGDNLYYCTTYRNVPSETDLKNSTWWIYTRCLQYVQGKVTILIQVEMVFIDKNSIYKVKLSSSYTYD